MFNFNRLKLRDRILIGYGIPLALTIAATTVVIVNAKKVEQQAAITEQGWLLVKQSDRLELMLYKRQSMIRTYLLTKDARFIQEYQDSVRDYNQLIQSLESLVQFSAPEQQQRLQQLKDLGQEIYQVNLKLINWTQQGNHQAVFQEFSRGKAFGLVEQASEVFRELNTTEDELQIERDQEAAAAIQSLVITAILGTLAAIVLAIIIGFWLASQIANQINEIAANIAASSSEIAATVEQQERAAIQQSSSVNETTTTMDQLNAAAQLSAQQAETAVVGAQQILTLVGQGNQAVNHTLDNMGTLTVRVNAVADQIVRLSEQTNQIGMISGLVADLANQTNMLALNAAVEAVRAGEHGKGFAVVASEIRKLADQSKRSAEKINGLVSDVQVAINSTVMVTDENSKAVERGTQITQQTADVFSNVTAAIHNIVTNVQQISLNTQQQAMGVEQVVQAMTALNAVARDTASGISQTRVSTHQLNTAAQDLRATI
ncbi:methyl-accepting chemotaxis protein [Pantanalinema rosaneae CENA516]|uniref:methyl-accepting chemotaxis protein n=1 Tax=Pantanalinema rosaneae TaxID=1620701 RepID=UPI003D6F8E84